MPIVYSIDPVDEDGDGEIDETAYGSQIYDIRMQDMASAKPAEGVYQLATQGDNTYDLASKADTSPKLAF